VISWGHNPAGRPDDQPTPGGSENLAGDYGGLLERVPAILYVADVGAAGRWHFVSSQIETILGFTAEEWCADPGLWAGQLHPLDRDRVLASEERPMVPRTEPAEYRMLRCDGRMIWIRDDAQLVRDEHGRVRWHGVISDITERKLADAELERRAWQQAAVARLGAHALERTTIHALMEEAVTAAAEILDVEMAAVGELVGGGVAFQVRAAFGWPEPVDPAATVAAGPTTQPGCTVLSGRPVVISDWSKEDRFERSEALQATGVRSGVTVAIDGLSGPFGVMAVHSTRPHEYSAGDVDFIQSLANVLAAALDRQITEDDIRHRALHDALTGLPNRVLFLDRLEQALARLRRHPGLVAVLFLDIDRFKLINDSLGHQAGDELLAVVAPRLRQAVRPSDTVARFGGDEFGILLDEIPSEHAAIATAERIAAVFGRPVVVDGNEHFVTASVGIALAQGGESAAVLIRDADAAMYRAKERGRARYELFDEVMRGRALERLRVENDLRRALERDELRLHYQPVVSLPHESIVSVEALLRWEHPERGLVLPGEFLGVAEETGMIRALGRWVVERALAQAANWYRSTPDLAPLSLSINLSPVELLQHDLPEAVAARLRATGLDPACLSLEITEGLLLDESEEVAEILRALKSVGVRIVLDDFGKGYSSLASLTRLPIDTLKVDRSFVAGLGTGEAGGAVTEAITSMARALALDVVGEGVETEVQAAELRRLGCQLAQGFYFSPPVAAEEITEMLRGGPPWLAKRPERA
jgi:diguanylate cyclase (GGDEF)-like protein/PAS domain S-box-containing protein